MPPPRPPVWWEGATNISESSAIEPHIDARSSAQVPPVLPPTPGWNEIAAKHSESCFIESYIGAKSGSQ